MKLYTGLNIELLLEVIDEKVGYTRIYAIDPHKLLPHSLSRDAQIYATFGGEVVYFSNFEEILNMDKRKLLAFKKITVILS